MTAAARKRRAPTLTLNLKPDELRVIGDVLEAMRRRGTMAGFSAEWTADTDAALFASLLSANGKFAKLRERARKGGG